MFLWPPRPEKAIPSELIQFYENQGWIAQLKKNGTCTVIDVDASGNSTFYTRHNEAHKAWTPPQFILDYFKQFPESTIVAELLHNKGPSVKNTLYIFDILVFASLSLVGETLRERLELIEKFPETENVITSKTITKDFLAVFEGLTSELDEGIVMKNPNARLKPCYKDGMNAGWQVKCRKPMKNYGF